MEQMRQRLSCADSTFRRLPHDTALAVIAGLGLAAADISVFEGSGHNPPNQVLADPEGAVERVRASLDCYRLALADVIVVFGSDLEELAPNHPDPAIRASSLRRFASVVPFAAGLGSPGITVLPGMRFDGVEERHSRRLAAEELSRRAAIAGEAGVPLSIEPHHGSIAATPEATLELLEMAPEVELTLDYSQFAFQGIPDEAVDPLLDRTRHFHVRQAAKGTLQAPTRAGSIDFPRLRDELLARGYEGYFATEYQWVEDSAEFVPVDCVSETAEMRDLLLAAGADAAGANAP